MRLRALVGAVLLGCAFQADAASPSIIKAIIEAVEAGPKAKATARAADLANESIALLKAGDLDGAIERLEAAAALMRNEDTADGRRFAALTEQRIAELRGWRQLLQAHREAKLSALRPDQAPTESRAASGSDDLSNLTAERQLVVKAVGEAYPRSPRFLWVSADVKQFANRFALGAREPPTHLAAARASHSAIASRWLATPLERRVFAIGAGADVPRIGRWARSLESQGYTVLFYDFRAQAKGVLCESETVGAFFGSAGHAVLVDSAAAAASRYVAVEVATARRIQGAGPRVIIVSPTEVTVRMLSGGTLGVSHADASIE